MFDLQNRMKLASKAQSALNRITESAENNTIVKKEHYHQVFEEYDDDMFEKKIKLDTIFYQNMFKNLNESYNEPINHLLHKLLETTREIYEHLNIKPKLYGFQTSSLNESDEFLDSSANRMINDFIKQNYYTLTQEQRERKYLPSVRHLAGEIILSESINEEEAIKFATKSSVMKEFIEKINFPLTVKSAIEECLSDENYGKIFNKDKLSELWESFEMQNSDISKILAVII